MSGACSRHTLLSTPTRQPIATYCRALSPWPEKLHRGRGLNRWAARWCGKLQRRETPRPPFFCPLFRRRYERMLPASEILTTVCHYRCLFFPPKSLNPHCKDHKGIPLSPTLGGKSFFSVDFVSEEVNTAVGGGGLTGNEKRRGTIITVTLLMTFLL